MIKTDLVGVYEVIYMVSAKGGTVEPVHVILQVLPVNQPPFFIDEPQD